MRQYYGRLVLRKRLGWTMGIFLVFVSSRRRHTRVQGDWSSDVCSSDLACAPVALVAARMQRTARGCRAHRASRLAQVAAIAETAPGSQAFHLHEAEGALIECRGGGRKVAHPGGVDQRGAV